MSEIEAKKVSLWTDVQEPNDKSNYHHATAKIGVLSYRIEWRGWEPGDRPAVWRYFCEGEECLGAAPNLAAAKMVAELDAVNCVRRIASDLVVVVEEAVQEGGPSGEELADTVDTLEAAAKLFGVQYLAAGLVAFVGNELKARGRVVLTVGEDSIGSQFIELMELLQGHGE